MDDLAQYSPRRRPRRFVEDEPFRFQTPLVFTLAPPAELTREVRRPRSRDLRRPLAGRGV
jgi:hypothetical protein